MKRVITIVLIGLFLISGCAGEGKKIKLDPKNPVTISVWYYYNGAILNAFEAMVREFNDTVGMERGIIVEGFAMGSVSELEKAVMASANKEVGSLEPPNIFASYADTAYAAEKMGMLANLGDYFTEEEQKEYVESYIEEGKIGLNGELRIFPVAKSTEVLMINKTDWLPFAKDTGASYEDLSTIEGIVRVSEDYYLWTDEMTPNIPNDGKAFFGRDSMANFFIIASMEFDTEIFQVDKGNVTLNINEEVMGKIWDNYYIPYINGYFTAYGKYRSDDVKVGDLLAYAGSTSSAAYFPREVTINNSTYPIEAKVLPSPNFEGGRKVMVQQGAGMVVTKSGPKEEYASAIFLKWFTDHDNNVEFSSLSGYLPVKKPDNDYNVFIEAVRDMGLDEKTMETMKIAFQEMEVSRMYTNKAFDGGTEARFVLEHNLQDKASADREAVLAYMAAGVTREEAVSKFDTEENFQNWLKEFKAALYDAAR